MRAGGRRQRTGRGGGVGFRSAVEGEAKCGDLALEPAAFTSASFGSAAAVAGLGGGSRRRREARRGRSWPRGTGRPRPPGPRRSHRPVRGLVRGRLVLALAALAAVAALVAVAGGGQGPAVVAERSGRAVALERGGRPAGEFQLCGEIIATDLQLPFSAPPSAAVSGGVGGGESRRGWSSSRPRPRCCSSMREEASTG